MNTAHFRLQCTTKDKCQLRNGKSHDDAWCSFLEGPVRSFAQRAHRNSGLGSACDSVKIKALGINKYVNGSAANYLYLVWREMMFLASVSILLSIPNFRSSIPRVGTPPQPFVNDADPIQLQLSRWASLGCGSGGCLLCYAPVNDKISNDC
jgi:hypothetical protein